MQAEFNEKISEFYKSVSKPLTELAELNMNTMAKWSKNTGAFEKLSRAKKPEEFICAQIELANTTAMDGIKYLQEACNIWLDALSQTNNTVTNVAREAAKKPSESDRSNRS